MNRIITPDIAKLGKRHAGGFLKAAGLPNDLAALERDIRSMSDDDRTETREQLLDVSKRLLKRFDTVDEGDLTEIEQLSDGILALVDELDKPDPRRPMLGEGRSADGQEQTPGSRFAREERAIGYTAGQRFRGVAGLRSRGDGVSLGQFLRAVAVGPRNAEERTALQTGSDAAGGYTVPTDLSSRLIDTLRAESVVNRAGAVVVPMNEAGNHSIAAVANDVVAGWRAELAAIDAGPPTFRRVDLAAKSLATIVRMSRELLADSLNLEMQLPLLIARAMAAEVDRAALVGNPAGASGEPTGIFNQSGITKVPPLNAGGVATNSDLVRLAGLVQAANAGMVSAFIMAPLRAAMFGAQSDLNGQPVQPPPMIAGVPILTTSNVPTNLGTGEDETLVFAGNWQHLLIGVREQVNVRMLTERFADTGEVAFVAHTRVDIAVEHPGAFAVLEEVPMVFPYTPVPEPED